MTYMSVYEALFLETKPYVEPTKPGVFIIGSNNKINWAEKIRRYFDWDNDGFAEASAWPGVGSQVLLIEKESDHKISILKTNTALKWDVLKNLDENKDGMLTQDDPEFLKLMIWKVGDISQGNKPDISPFSEFYRSLNLETLKADRVDSKNDSIDLIYLRTDKVNSFYTHPVVLDPLVYKLPTLRGYGYIPYLHIAMSLDSNLLEKVQTLSKCNVLNIFSHQGETDAMMRDILFQWAGVDGIDPSSRGPFIDARELAFLEKFMARDFYQLQKWSNPRPYAAKDLKKAWQLVLAHESALLIFQTCGKSLFYNNAKYNPRTGHFTMGGGLNQQVVSLLLIHSKKNLSQEEQSEYIFNLKQFVKNLSQPMPLQDQIFMMMQQ